MMRTIRLTVPARLSLARRRDFMFGGERLPATRIIAMRRDDDEVLALI